ncbi:MAG: cbb3-type cytochrome c oxidase subunit 3 [Marinibacterium sp.]
MDTYSLTRAFADSWMLLALFLFFVGVILWVFRPGASKEYQDTANIPLRNDTLEASAAAGGTLGEHDKKSEEK